MREVQNSLIPWLPVIPANWHEVRLKDIGTARNGLTYKPDDLVEEHQGTIVLRSSNIQNSKLSFNDNVFVKSFPEELRVLKNDIIICSRNGSVSLVGKCALIEHDINATFGAFMMRFRTTQHPKFSFYLLQSTISAYKSRFGTTTVNQLTNSVFGNMLTALPPKEEQEAIAAYLDKECEKIGREIELLERKADAYKRLRRSLINRAVTRGLNPDVHLKPSGNDWIGDIPQHWRIERNKNLLIERKDIVGEDKSFKLLSLTLNGIIIRDMEAGGKFPAEFNSYKKVHPNNLVFCLFDMDETPRTIGLSSYTGMITGAYDVFVVVPEVVSPKWVYYFYFDIDQRKALKPYYTGLRKVVKTQKFANIHIPIPPNKEQQEIVAYLDEKCAKIDAIIEKIGTKIERLKELKRSLINEVVTGKRAIIINKPC